MTQSQPRSTRHILSLSGGKDSTALAIYMRDKVPEMEYVFCDTGEELQETYDYLERLQAYLGKEIVYLKNMRQGSVPDRLREMASRTHKGTAKGGKRGCDPSQCRPLAC
ncbi:Phosphoadenosine phosphosulfate reductase family protein [Deinococcus reticulitermitis]|uniref:Phosphoadenosine phosphosulfate reductase family protein n=1 Tax=Deinococcus reticulitermitis TaxID=856736 RepID=A0A1H7CWE7_9DEIO|nr:phosphoadenosine phosphosulfate reductase family protein [Deinococcus reticulitermitis]SEJ93978.1 Phosphoadenosine phosphosulfate reductase family protein [Deinococcus reticulitermitis]